MCDTQEDQQIPKLTKQCDTPSEFKTPLQQLRLKMREKFLKKKLALREEKLKNKIANEKNNEQNDPPANNKKQRKRQPQLEQQHRIIQMNSDQIISQLYELQRSSVLNAKFQLEQFPRVNYYSNKLVDDPTKVHRDDSIHRIQPTSYTYSCQQPQEQVDSSKQSQNYFEIQENPWWKLPPYNPNGNARVKKEIIPKEILNLDLTNVYPVVLKLFCEKYNRKCVMKLIDNTEYLKKQLETKTSKNAGVSLVNYQFACKVFIDEVKFSIMFSKSMKVAKNNAAESAIERLIEHGTSKERQFFEKYLSPLQNKNNSNNKINHSVKDIALPQSEQHQRQQMQQQSQQQLQRKDPTDEEIDVNQNFIQELSLFTQETLRKHISWDVISQLESNSWLATVYVGNLTETGSGSSKKAAKNSAALKLLQRCKQLKMKDNIIDNTPKPAAMNQMGVSQPTSKTENSLRSVDVSGSQITNSNTSNSIYKSEHYLRSQSYSHEQEQHRNYPSKNQFDFKKETNHFQFSDSQNPRDASHGFKSTINEPYLNSRMSNPFHANHLMSNSQYYPNKRLSLNQKISDSLRWNSNYNQNINANRNSTAVLHPLDRNAQVNYNSTQFMGNWNNHSSFIANRQGSRFDNYHCEMNDNRRAEGSGYASQCQTAFRKADYQKSEGYNQVLQHAQAKNNQGQQVNNSGESSQDKENKNPNAIGFSFEKQHPLPQNLFKDLKSNNDDCLNCKRRNLQSCSQETNDEESAYEEGEIITKKCKLEGNAMDAQQ